MTYGSGILVVEVDKTAYLQKVVHTTPAEFQVEDADPGYRREREMVQAGGCLGGAGKKHSKTRFFTGFLAAAALPKMCSIQLPKHVKTVQQLQPQGQTRRRRAVTMFGGISGVLL